MPAGRPRKPLALKVLQGTVEKSRLNKRAPRPEAKSIAPPPSHLSEREKRAWRHLAKLVDPLRVATPADVIAFEQLARSYAIVNQAHEELRADERELTYEQVNETGSAQQKRREELNIIRDFKKLLHSELGAFGLTPAAREKVSAAAADNPGDPLDEFTTGGNGAA